MTATGPPASLYVAPASVRLRNGLLALVGVPSGAAKGPLSHPGGADRHCEGVQGLPGVAGGQGSVQKHPVQGAGLHRGWWRRWIISCEKIWQATSSMLQGTIS